jgi:hypothetical protein
MSTPTCGICEKPVADGSYVCANDAAVLRRSLLALGVPEKDRRGDPMPTLAEELELVVRRETRFVTRVGSRSTGSPLPYNPTGSELAWVLQNTLTTWVRLVCEERGLTGPVLDAARNGRIAS